MRCDKCGTECGQNVRCATCGASLVQKIEPNKPSTAAFEAPQVKKDIIAKIAPAGGFWNFDILITKAYIKAIFITGCAAIALVMIVTTISGAVYGGFWGFLGAAILAVIVGALAFLLFRLVCEGLIIFFKMHEELQKISQKH